MGRAKKSKNIPFPFPFVVVTVSKDRRPQLREDPDYQMSRRALMVDVSREQNRGDGGEGFVNVNRWGKLERDLPGKKKKVEREDK